MFLHRYSPRASGGLIADLPLVVHFLHCGLINELHIFSLLANTIWDIFSVIITSLGSLPCKVGNLLKIGYTSSFFFGYKQPSYFHIECLVFLQILRVAQFSFGQKQPSYFAAPRYPCFC